MSIVTNETFARSIDALRSVLEVEPTLVVDVETNGLEPYKTNQLCGIGVGQTNYLGLSQYYPFRHHQGENLSYEQLQELIRLLNTLVQTYVGYNLKFDLHFLENEGLEVLTKRLVDVIVMVRLTEHSDIKDLALTATGRRRYGPEFVQYDIDTKKELRSNGWNKDFSMAPPVFLGEYCKKDVKVTARLFKDCEKEILRTSQKQVFTLECDLTKVLYKMERLGITIDVDYANRSKKALTDRLNVVEAEILIMAKRKKWNHDIPVSSNKHEEDEFNISSPKQIGEVFNSMGIESPIKTLKGQDSWNEAALININHRMAGLIRQYRTLEKLKSTYIEPYLETSIMHTSFCNWGTATGRLSSRVPNLQNIPRNHFKLQESNLTEEGKIEIINKISAMVGAKGMSMNENLSDDVLKTWSFVGDDSYDFTDDNQISIRRLFIPRKGYSLVGFDYQQMEVRVFMSYFRNEIIDSILMKDNVDFHSEAAKLAFNIDESSPKFNEYRQAAKAITFGTIYGIGNQKLSQQLGTTAKEAGQFKKQYFEGMKGSKEFFKAVIEKVIMTKYIHNKYNRQYKINSAFAYKGVNYLVQGTSADLLSERMLEVDKYLVDKKSHILLQVHDELICEIHNTELKTIPSNIQAILETNSLGIPLKVDVETFNGSWAVKQQATNKDNAAYIDWN